MCIEYPNHGFLVFFFRIQAGELIWCEVCPEVFHIKCLDPPLATIPEGMTIGIGSGASALFEKTSCCCVEILRRFSLGSLRSLRGGAPTYTRKFESCLLVGDSGGGLPYLFCSLSHIFVLP